MYRGVVSCSGISVSWRYINNTTLLSGFNVSLFFGVVAKSSNLSSRRKG